MDFIGKVKINSDKMQAEITLNFKFEASDGMRLIFFFTRDILMRKKT